MGISQTPQVWLDFVASKHQEGILLQWDSVDTLFPAGFIDTLFTAFIHCIEHLVSDDANWAQPLPDLLPEQQKQQRRNERLHRPRYQKVCFMSGSLLMLTITPLDSLWCITSKCLALSH
ncbi:hypothetical protein Q8W16_23870 [Photobacterium damselae subsp. piscicida]|nr:hypothetical protein [Photobacterium damselae subsp. piscicida]